MKNSQTPVWKRNLIFKAAAMISNGGGYTKYEIIDSLKSQHKDISGKSLESAVKIACKQLKRKDTLF